MAITRLDMSPSFPAKHRTYRSPAHVELLGQSNLSCPSFSKGAYKDDILGRQLGSPILLTMRNGGDMEWLSTLGKHVSGVVFVGSKEKMIWANTLCIVAMVADKKPFGNRAIMQFPTNTVCLDRLPVAVDEAPETSISLHQPCPYPARTKCQSMFRNRPILINLRPESPIYSSKGPLTPSQVVPVQEATTYRYLTTTTLTFHVANIIVYTGLSWQ